MPAHRARADRHRDFPDAGSPRAGCAGRAPVPRAAWRGPAGAPEECADVITLPASVRDAIGERIDSLPYDLRDLLATAALAGRAVHADLLSHVHGMSRLRVAALADALVERRLLVE